MTGPAQWGPLRVADRQRRQDVRAADDTGLDAIDVRSNGAEPVLRLTFLGRTPTDIDKSNVLIVSPAGNPGLTAIDVQRYVDARGGGPYLSVRLSGPGGHGTYLLRLVGANPDGRPLRRAKRGVDPAFAELTFSFDPQQPVPFARDPRPLSSSGGPKGPNNYLARDYQGLRQLMLDRLAVTDPTSKSERHAADLTVALVELFAYLGDDLSYYQDAVATEAYLATARRRISVRRHGRLVGYRMHDGCHARAWLTLAVRDRVTVTLTSLRFVTDQGTVFTPVAAAPRPSTGGMGTHPTRMELLPAHSDITIWTFGESDATLCAGATTATLVDGGPVPASAARSTPPKLRRQLELAAGDVLIFEATHDEFGLGAPNAAARHAVRLTAVRHGYDQLYRQPTVEVEWAEEDALPFDLRLRVDATDGTRKIVAHACGNVILVAHGEPVNETLAAGVACLGRPAVACSQAFPSHDQIARSQARRLRSLYGSWQRMVRGWLALAVRGYPVAAEHVAMLREQFGAGLLDLVGLTDGSTVEDARQQAGALEELLDRADRYFSERRQRLEVLALRCESYGPMAGPLLAEVSSDWGAELFAALDPDSLSCWGPARETMRQDPRAALPLVLLATTDDDPTTPTTVWTPRRDLIGVDSDTPVFVCEIDDAGFGQLRLNLSAPERDRTQFRARYWVGTGSAGNVLADTITGVRAVDDPGAAQALSAVELVRNPLPATGGTDPERIAEATRAIPGSATLDQPRALTAPDYARLAATNPRVAHAVAELRAGGVRTVADVRVQPLIGQEPSQELLQDVRAELMRIRRIGHDFIVRGPDYRSVSIAVTVTLDSTADRGGTAAAVTAALGSDGGTSAFFGPRQLDFGRTVWASALVARAQQIPGVVQVELTAMRFLDTPAGTGVPPRLELGPTQIARMDNDPNRPDHGYLSVTVKGGR